MYEIEKGIPIEENRGPRASRYGFDRLEVGDSIFIPASDDVLGNRGRSAASLFGKRHGVKLAVRKSEKDGISGFRVWRLPDSPKPILKIA